MVRTNSTLKDGGAQLLSVTRQHKVVDHGCDFSKIIEIVYFKFLEVGVGGSPLI